MDKLSHLKLPEALQEGDKVAVVSLSWGGPGTLPHKYYHGKKQLEEEFGLQVEEMPNAMRDGDWVSRNPQARADDLMQAFSDPDVKAIISSIGGSDSIRIVKYVDQSIISKNPKIFLGYSDTTVSHFLCLKNNLASYYGPSIMSGFGENGGLHDLLKSSLRANLFDRHGYKIKSGIDEGWVCKQLDWDEPENLNKKRALFSPMDWNIIQGEGKVKGRLIGGCMDVLEFIKGTDLWPSNEIWDNAILFFETSEDAPSVDNIIYWLRWYAYTGILDRVNAIIFGRYGGTQDGSEYDDFDKSIEKFFKVELAHKKLPIVTRMPFGHTDPMITLRYGGLVELDLEYKTLGFLD